MPHANALSIDDRLNPDPRIFRAQIQTLYQTLPVSVAGALLVVLVYGFIISFWEPTSTVVAWCTAMALQFALWIYGVRSYRKVNAKGPLKENTVIRLARRVVWGSLVAGCAWGYAGVAFITNFSSVPADYQYLLMLSLAGMITGAAFAQGSYLTAFWAFALPSCAPVILGLLLSGKLLQFMFGLTALFFMAAVWRFVLVLNRTLLNAFELQFANADLAKQLAQQHELLLQANAAKSKFLASASHDLRQPLHAMELFVEALRQTRQEHVRQQITDKLRRSTAAMRGLLDALLDISKLDAGVVTPRLECIPLAPLLSLTVEELRDAAQAKGLYLRVRVSSSAATVTDPGLLKSIVSNLVSNAVRYTVNGGVLLSVRRSAAHWLIDVYDTGPGIALQFQEEVFREFVQLHNPQRDRTQGLGLGLAIVRRLTVLLKHDLELRSKPGAGCRFRLKVPVHQAPLIERAENVYRGPLELGALVVVIDDELEGCQAMQMVLSAWGLRCVYAPDAKSAALALANESARPLLIISDYRLRDGDGIQAIAFIRAEYNVDAEMAALLLTGDTAVQDLQRLQASGIELMHKPVDTTALQDLLWRLSRQRAAVV
ncbi:MAG: hybrid sensor histidine kinase/response regulator [Rhodoferax sp.]|nr:hybrid sensor histidine kinase/response regulator [Rhodoferax sp.]